MLNTIKYIIRKTIKIWWPTYAKNFPHNELVVIKYFLLQKVLRINSKVNWPVHPTTQILAPEKISSGNRAPGMSMGCFIDARNGVQIGNNVWIGPRVSLISMDHETLDYNKYIKNRPIIIGNDCLICTNAIILPGVKLGCKVIVAAGSVVTHSFEESNIVIGGIPAKKIKHIKHIKPCVA